MVGLRQVPALFLAMIYNSARPNLLLPRTPCPWLPEDTVTCCSGEWQELGVGLDSIP